MNETEDFQCLGHSSWTTCNPFLLFYKFSIIFTFILGGQFLLPQRAKIEKMEFIQPQKWMRQRVFSAWGIQTGPFAGTWEIPGFVEEVGNPSFDVIAHYPLNVSPPPVDWWCVGGAPCRAGGIFAAPSWLAGHLTISNRCEGGVRGFQLNGRRRLGAGMARRNRGRALGCKGGDGDVAAGSNWTPPFSCPVHLRLSLREHWRKFAVGRSRKSVRSNSKLR